MHKEYSTGAVIVEHFGDNNYWGWFGVYINATPQEALRHYAREMGFDFQEIKQEGAEFYLGEDARAYNITLEDLSL